MRKDVLEHYVTRVREELSAAERTDDESARQTHLFQAGVYRKLIQGASAMPLDP